MGDETTAQPAGWYQDPGGSGGQRWWDGRQWGGLAQPQPPPRARPASVKAAMLAVAGAALAAVGCFLPWITVSAPLVGTLSRNGMGDFGDGWVVIALAVVGGGIAAIHIAQPQSGRVGVVPAVTGALMGAVAAHDGWKVLERLAEVEDDSGMVTAGLGPGLFAVGFGAVAMLAGGVVMWRAGGGANGGARPAP